AHRLAPVSLSLPARSRCESPVAPASLTWDAAATSACQRELVPEFAWSPQLPRGTRRASSGEYCLLSFLLLPSSILLCFKLVVVFRARKPPAIRPLDPPVEIAPLII